MDRPRKAFLKFFTVVFPGWDFGRPEYSSHSSFISQSLRLKGSGVWTLFWVCMPSRNGPLGLSDIGDKACVSLISFVELFSCLFTPGMSLTPKAQPTLSAVASSRHRSTPDRRISAPMQGETGCIERHAAGLNKKAEGYTAGSLYRAAFHCSVSSSGQSHTWMRGLTQIPR